MKIEGWSKFWMNEGDAFFQIMKISTTVFAKRLDTLLNMNGTQRVLDYGCGPGFLIDYLVSKDVAVSGADINPNFLKECKGKYPALKFVLVTPNMEEANMALAKELKGDRFNYIVVLSMVQYFDHAKNLEDLIKMLNPFLTNNGEIIIADVVGPKTSSIIDGLALVWHCSRMGRFLVLAKFIMHLLTSNYSTLSKRLKLTAFTEEQMQRIATDCSMGLVKVNHLTIHPTRSNYILTKTAKPEVGHL